MSFLGDIKQFSKTKLKTTHTLVTTPDGRVLEESRDKHGRTHTKVVSDGGLGFVGDVKPDVQVGEIRPGVILGAQDVAMDLNLLEKYRVTHILNLASMVENLYPDRFTYKKLDILDLPATDIRTYFDEAFPFIEQGRASGCVLVHCNAGVSRAPSMVIGYLMKTEGLHFSEAFDYVKSQRPSINPNAGFMTQLRRYVPWYKV